MDKRVIRRYSEAFKRQVVREYEEGASARSLREKYGIRGGSTVNSWVRKYGREGSRYQLMVIQKPEEQTRVRELAARVAELEKALAQVTLDKLMLESQVAVLEAETGHAGEKTPHGSHRTRLPSATGAGDELPSGPTVQLVRH